MKLMKKNKNWNGKWDGKSLQFKKVGLSAGFFEDIYYNILTMTWLSFIICFFGGYLLINGFFASLYFISGDNLLNVNPTSYWEAFVFSFQTSASIGYGYFLPKTDLAHFIVMFDSMSGMLFVALATGIAFGKFSRPSSMVMFSKNMLINKQDGKEVLSFRIGNSRESHIVDASVKVAVSVLRTTAEGETMRRIYDLDLTRSESPLFGLSWTVMHPIDESSLIYHLPQHELFSEETFFIVSLSGIDEAFAHVVYDRHIYKGSDLLQDKYFLDVMDVDAQGNSVIDYSNFDKVRDLNEDDLAKKSAETSS